MAGENYTYSGADVRIRLGTTAVPCEGGCEPPKETIKTETIRRLGDQIARVRTVGILEMGDASITLSAAVYAKRLLPLVPANGWSLFEFVVTVSHRHPLLGSPYIQVWDRCRFAGIEPDKIEPSEKAIMIKLPISVIQVFHKGADGIRKSLALDPQQPTPAASAFLL
jgi:hypothetical protein